MFSQLSGHNFSAPALGILILSILMCLIMNIYVKKLRFDSSIVIHNFSLLAGSYDK